MADLKLGIDACFARKRWPDPKDWMRIVREDLNLDYVEFCSDLLDPILTPESTRVRTAREIKRIAEDLGLTIVVYYTGLIPHCLNLLSHPDLEARAQGLRWCVGAIETASYMGVDGIGGHFDTIAYKDWSDPERRKFMIDNLLESFRYLSRVAHDAGQKFILWEQMYTPNETPHTIREAHELYERVNEGAAVPIYLTVDVGHACHRGYPYSPDDGDPYQWLREFAQVSPVIHIQQTDASASHHWPFTAKYNDRGIVDAQKVIDAIDASGSKENYLILEIFHSLGTNEDQLISDLKESVAHWRQYLK
ncbi:MAG: TIM barrel protein [Firmicutes bacterium]|nr:TIM barrel protein [Bacillota bacterium]